MPARLQRPRQADGEAALRRRRRGQGFLRGGLGGSAHGPPLRERSPQILSGRYRLLRPRKVLRLHGSRSLYQGVLVFGLDLDQRKGVRGLVSVPFSLSLVKCILINPAFNNSYLVLPNNMISL